ncbi:MAG: MFS transporter [Chloroflexi bacterium]|nr:MFS transporter [Chloroflexota bacterium]
MQGGAGWLRQARAAAGRPWVRALAVLWIAQVISEMAFSFALPFLPLYIQELGVESVAQAGLWAGAMAGGFAVMMGLMGPIWGMVADRHGRRLMIQRALFGACVVIGAMSLVQSPGQLLALRLLQGSLTGVVAATMTVVSLTVPRRHLGFALGLMHAAMFGGTALGPILGGVFSDRFGYRSAFVATSALFLVSGLLVTLFVPEPPREPVDPKSPRESLGASIGKVVAMRELMVVVGIAAVVRFASMAPSPVLPLFIQQLVDDQTHLATTAGVVVASTGIASTLSALIVGRLADRYGRGRTLLISLAAAAALAVPQAFVTSVWQLLLLRMAMGLALGGMSPAIQALLSDLTPPGRRGMAFGVMASGSALGNGGGPVFGSLVAAGFGLPAAFLAQMPIFLAGAWLVRRLSSRRSLGKGPGLAILPG